MRSIVGVLSYLTCCRLLVPWEVVNLRGLEFKFTLILTSFQTWLLLRLYDLLKLLPPELIDRLIVVWKTLANGQLFHLFLHSTSNQSIDHLLFVKRKSWGKIILSGFISFWLFLFERDFGLECQLFFVPFVLIIDSWFVLSFLQRLFPSFIVQKLRPFVSQRRGWPLGRRKDCLIYIFELCVDGGILASRIQLNALIMTDWSIYLVFLLTSWLRCHLFAGFRYGRLEWEVVVLDWLLLWVNFGLVQLESCKSELLILLLDVNVVL